MKNLTKLQLGDIGEVTVVDSREDPTERARISDNAPHAHYATERDDIHKELEAFRQVCQAIGEQPGWSVMEMFGGSGWHSAIIQKLVRPRRHVAWDISADCVESIRRSSDKTRAVCRDSFRYIIGGGREWDWVHADYNLLTRNMLLRTEPDDQLNKSLVAIFTDARECVTITDTTPYHIAPFEAQEWFNSFAASVMLFFGWYAHRTFSWGPAAMHLFRREPPDDQHMLVAVNEPMPVTILEKWQE